jgi:hypothetical protein
MISTGSDSLLYTKSTEETVTRNFIDLARHDFQKYWNHFDITSGGNIYITNSNGRGCISDGGIVRLNCFLKTGTVVINCRVAQVWVAALKTFCMKGGGGEFKFSDTGG